MGILVLDLHAHGHVLIQLQQLGLHVLPAQTQLDGSRSWKEATVVQVLAVHEGVGE